MEKPEECAICKLPIGTSPKAVLGEKGSISINKASEERSDSIHCTPGQQVHQECRKKYCKPDQVAKDLRQKSTQEGIVVHAQKQVLRSAESPFNFSTDFFFCAKPAILGRKRKTPDLFQVKTV